MIIEKTSLKIYKIIFAFAYHNTLRAYMQVLNMIHLINEYIKTP